MLYQFIVENFKSFRDEAILNLVAASYDQHPSHIHKRTKNGTNVLRTGAFYGANASGKTNLVKAIHFAKNLITVGTSGEMAIDTKPFRLSEKSRHAPSRFEFIFEADDTIYHYGFVLFSDRIAEEWLLDVTQKKEKVIFERTLDGDKTKVTPGKKYFKTKNDRELINFIAQTTRINQLFLKEAFEKNVEQIKPVYRWFEEDLQIVPAIADYRALEMRTKSDESFSNFLGRLLKDAGTGIEKIEAESLELDFDKYLPALDSKQREMISSHIRKEQGAITIDDGKGHKYFIHIEDPKKGPELLRLRALHKDDQGNMVSFELKEESEGTRRYLNLLPMLYDTQADNRVYIIDELERRLHSDLVKSFVEMFLKQNENSKSQLIFTSHNTNLLDQDLLRRDEIWFIEKDLNSGASSLYPLTDMDVRHDLKLDKAYLHGRFGATPKINKSFLYQE
ncbi:MAG: ATP/GTP-binding protein [Gracilimonas sp.]